MALEIGFPLCISRIDGCQRKRVLALTSWYQRRCTKDSFSDSLHAEMIIHAIRGFSLCCADRKLDCTKIYKVQFAHNRSLIMTRAIQLYFMSHVQRSGLFTWLIKYNWIACFIVNDQLCTNLLCVFWYNLTSGRQNPGTAYWCKRLMFDYPCRMKQSCQQVWEMQGSSNLLSIYCSTIMKIECLSVWLCINDVL